MDKMDKEESTESDVSRGHEESEWLAMLNANPAYAFLNDPAEDIYTSEDGKPYRAEE